VNGFLTKIYSNCKWVFTRWQDQYYNLTHIYTCHIHNTHIAYIQMQISHKIAECEKSSPINISVSNGVDVLTKSRTDSSV
jgi:hypothetical protein